MSDMRERFNEMATLYMAARMRYMRRVGLQPPADCSACGFLVTGKTTACRSDDPAHIAACQHFQPRRPR